MYTDILIIDAALYYPEEFSVAYVNESVNLNMPSRTITEIFYKMELTRKIQNILL